MIKHNKPQITVQDKKAICIILDSGYIAQGEKVREFENAIVKYLSKDKGYCCALSSGTAALFLALYALGVKEKDEIIAPTYVCSAVLNAIFMLKAIPILADINLDDFNISFEEAKKLVTYRTKAIIIPHIFGVPADIDKFKTLGVPMVEDCAQAIGAKYKGKKVGTIGEIAIFSFYATKLLTTGHGGMVYSKNKKFIDRIRDYRDFDFRRKYYPRFNLQMTDLQAALGLSQLKKLGKFLKRRKKIALRYEQVMDIKKISYQKEIKESERVYYRFVFKQKNIMKTKQILYKNNVETIFPVESWELLHRYLKLDRNKFSNAERISKIALSLPLYPALRNFEVEKIVNILKLIEN